MKLIFDRRSVDRETGQLRHIREFGFSLIVGEGVAEKSVSESFFREFVLKVFECETWEFTSEVCERVRVDEELAD